MTVVRGKTLKMKVLVFSKQETIIGESDIEKLANNCCLES